LGVPSIRPPLYLGILCLFFAIQYSYRYTVVFASNALESARRGAVYRKVTICIGLATLGVIGGTDRRAFELFEPNYILLAILVGGPSVDPVTFWIVTA
jgi:hypothetical protein